MVYEPEILFLKANRCAPNSDLPVLIYRDCLPLPLSESKVTEFLESHAWIKKGTWGHIARRHFHPNTHECYGIFQGQSTMLVGCGHNDVDGGANIEVHAGDVVVLPAGTGHCNVQSTQDYRYIGVYPEGSPQWRNEYGKEESERDGLRKEAERVAFPTQDPVNGSDGPLLQLWLKN